MDLTDEDYDLWLRSSGLANQLDPMTPTQLEASRRSLADMTFQNDVLTGRADQAAPQGPPQMAYPFPGTELDPISETDREAGARAVANARINDSEVGRFAQGMAIAGPVGGAVSGGMRAAGGLATRVAPEAVNAATQYVARMPGISGMLARQVGGRAPQAAGNVATIEAMKRIGTSGPAVAQEDVLPPLPAFSANNKESVEALQTHLAQHGFNPGAIDGALGGARSNTNSARNAYLAKRAEQMAAQNTPEMRQLKNLEREANARKTLEGVRAAEAARKGVERVRRAKVLEDADDRYANRAQSLGQQVTQAAQDWVGPAIMYGAAALGSRGIAKVPGNRRFANEVNTLAQSNARRRTPPSREEMQGFNKAYDTAKPKNSLAEMTGVYGALGVEMFLAGKYLESARNEYTAAVAAFEAGAKAGGGKERELADRVAKAKAEVQKWERLQGAGLHGMGYYTAGKAFSGAANAVGGRPSALATQQREQYKRLLKNRNASRPQPGLLESPQTGGGSRPPQSPQSPPKAQGTNPAGQAGAGSPNPANPTGASTAQGQGSSSRPRGGVAGKALGKPIKVQLAEQFQQNGGKLSQKQAEGIASGVSPEKVKEFLSKLRDFRKYGMTPDAILKAVKDGRIASLAAGAGAAGLAGQSILDMDLIQ